ncbi:MAG: zinc-dependent peptidase [Microthrixaceae bacterium]
MGIFRHRPPEDALPEGWRSLLSERIRHWEYLSGDERDQLGHLSGQLIAGKHWEASNGFDLTPEMQLLIAAQASLLVLGLSFEHFREVSAIIVHPTTVVLTGPRGSAVSGLMTDSPMPILGQASERGPIIIAWDAVLNDALHFDIPVTLRDHKPELYEVFAAFYNQDPAARVERSIARSTE